MGHDSSDIFSTLNFVSGKYKDSPKAIQLSTPTNTKGTILLNLMNTFTIIGASAEPMRAVTCRKPIPSLLISVGKISADQIYTPKKLLVTKNCPVIAAATFARPSGKNATNIQEVPVKISDASIVFFLPNLSQKYTRVSRTGHPEVTWRMK